GGELHHVRTDPLSGNPLPLGEGGATASGLARRAEGRAEREPDRAKPQEKNGRMFPSPRGRGKRLGRRELFQSRHEQSLRHIDLGRVVFQRSSITERIRWRLSRQVRAQRFSVEKFLDGFFSPGPAGDAAENDSRILNGFVAELQT